MDIQGKFLLKETAKNWNANSFFSAFMHGSIIHKQDRKAICVNHFQKINFLRGESQGEAWFTFLETLSSCDSNGFLHT